MDSKNKRYKSYFYTYSPYLTYSDPLNFGFIGGIHKTDREMDSDTESLFILGKDAYQRLPLVESREMLKQVLTGYHQTIDFFCGQLKKLDDKGQLTLSNHNGKEIKMDWNSAEDEHILKIGWKVFSDLKQDDTNEAFRELFLINALIEIDHAIVALDLRETGAVIAAINAANSLSNAVAIESGGEKLQEARRELAYRGATERLKRDPRQKEKQFIFECWENWQQHPASYASKAAFARDMLTKCEHLTSQKKIEDWCREWVNKHSPN